MSEELKPTAGAEGAAPLGASGEATPSGSVVQTTAETPVSPEVQRMIDAAIQQVRKEYDGEGGHLSQLKSKKDKEIAQLRRQLHQRSQAQFQEAQGLMQAGDYEEAAQLLYDQVSGLQGQQMAESAQDQIGEWVGTVMAQMGYDLEKDEKAAGMALEWVERIMQHGDNAWDFTVLSATQRIEEETQRADNAEKEMKKMAESLPELIKAEVAKVLTAAGAIPAATGEGGAAKKETDWRNVPASKLVREGLAARRKAPIRRQKTEVE